MPAKASDTKQQILAAAERHFAEYGYAGTSVRGVIKDANVNLAAVHYHFGSKEELYGAVLEQYARPIVEMQLKDLRALLQDGSPPSVESVVRTFYFGPLTLISQTKEKARIASLLLARSFTEPEEVQPIANQQFDPCRKEFADALTLALPQASVHDHRWNVEFMVGVIVAFLMRRSSVEKTRMNVEESIERLTSFVASGIKGGAGI